MNSLYIQEGEILIQYQNKVFKIPETFNLDGLWSLPGFEKAVASISASLGTVFKSVAENGRIIGVVRNCPDCAHSLLVPLKIRGYYSPVADVEFPCSYKGQVEEIFVYRDAELEKRKEECILMAKEDSCSLRDAFYISAIENSLLDNFLVKGARPGKFQFISRLIPGKAVLDCIRQYRKMARAFPKH